MANIFPRLRLLKAHVTRRRTVYVRVILASPYPSDSSSSSPYCSFARRRFRLVTLFVFPSSYPFFPIVSVILPHPVPRSPSSLISSCHPVHLLFVPTLKRYEWPSAPHTRKRKTFSLHVPSTFLFGPLSIVSLCAWTRFLAPSRLPSCFCILYTACSSIVCPRVITYADCCHVH